MTTNPATQIWEAALGELQLQVSKPNYRTWLLGTTGLNYENGNFVIGVPNTFVAEYLEKNQLSLIQKTLIGITNQDMKVSFQVHNQAYSPDNKALALTVPNLNSQYTFDSFIEGDCNRLARAAALCIAEQPGVRYYNPLYIYGEHGMGKTHLLQAIGHSALSRRMYVLYVSAEQFTNEFVNSIHEYHKAEQFREKYRNADMLLVDDIHFICGKEKTEERFCHTFNELHDRNCQIVVTGDCTPKAMPLLDKRLSSRFEGGLVTEIKPPDFQTRLAILRAKSQQQGVNIGTDVLDFLAQQSQHNIRELEGALNRIIAGAKLLKTIVTKDIASQALNDLRNNPSTQVAPGVVIETVASYFQLAAPDLIGKKRDKETTLARHLAIFLLRQKTRCSLTEISRALGGRYPSTIARAYERIESELENDSQLKHHLSEIEVRLHYPVTPPGTVSKD